MPSVSPYNFGEALTAALDDTGVSAEELGRRLGYASKGRSVRKWKNQGTMPGMDNVLRIAAALGVPVERLLPTPAQRAQAAGEEAEDGP